MVPSKSLDCLTIVVALARYAQRVFEIQGFTPTACKKTIAKLSSRAANEGVGFFTKTLPALGKALDRAMSSDESLDCTKLRFTPLPGTKLPKLFGELFQHVLSKDGTLLRNPDAQVVGFLRQVLYLFYKYELPYDRGQVQAVLDSFTGTEIQLDQLTPRLHALKQEVEDVVKGTRRKSLGLRFEIDNLSEVLGYPTIPLSHVCREARIAIASVLASYDPSDIIPRHGPGVVATKQRFKGKYQWSNISHRILQHYPLDAYFYASLGHVCDSYASFGSIRDEDLPAKVILVPKDSRGPRLISAEPVDFQWIQQGIMRSLVDHVEAHPLTKGKVNFTDQSINGRLALVASRSGEFVTLDLKEASDRVHIDLVRLLFPPHLFEKMASCRSTATRLPNGKVLPLSKFAPMGSALCFPVLALTVWSILHGAATDKYVRENIYVYGDDVIVPRHFALCAIRQLEGLGLLVNRSKSCLQGLFRESCGVDAFNGVDVTPVRLRTCWTTRPSTEAYASWISYHNLFYKRGYFEVCSVIRTALSGVYRQVPGPEVIPSAPGLIDAPIGEPVRRYNSNYQRFEYKCRTLASRKTVYSKDNWISLLRFFTESGKSGSSCSRVSNYKFSHFRSSNASENVDLRLIDQLKADHSPSSDLGVYTPRRRNYFQWRFV